MANQIAMNCRPSFADLGPITQSGRDLRECISVVLTDSHPSPTSDGLETA
jgi:hypothetical protein